MKLAALATVQQRLRLGAPLPFNVRNGDGTLLVARGALLAEAAQLAALLERGAWVDLAELQTAADVARHAPREKLPGLWHETLGRISETLAACEGESFRAALDDVSSPALALVERDPDLAIFQILTQSDGPGRVDIEYAARRALHAAITASLVAQRLSWAPHEVEKAFKVALTMNVSMLELQGLLARQSGVPTPAQRAELRSHPMRSVRMLQAAGVADDDWLQAVLQHHEVEDGSGYPAGRSDVCELASLVRRADIYTSKLAARSNRDAQAADVAGRAMFMADPAHPMTHALVKEFGIYPPGSYVRLANGALGVVVARGPVVTAPVVACLTDATGRLLARPQRVDTTTSTYAVTGLVHPRSGQPRVKAETLVSLG